MVMHPQQYLMRHQCCVGIRLFVLFVVALANLFDPVIEIAQDFVVGSFVFLWHPEETGWSKVPSERWHERFFTHDMDEPWHTTYRDPFGVLLPISL